MKKVLTILVVLALVAGFAFAAKTQETHTLTITAAVDVAVPEFQLFRDNTLKTNTDAKDFKYEQAAYEATDAAGFKLDAGGSVIVSARVANLAKQKQNYTLQFTDGVFNVNRNGGAGTKAPTITVAKNNTTTDGVTLSQGENSDTVTAAFNGTKMTVSGYTIATATYAYSADSTIDPGTYEADIVLTVSAV